MAPAKRPHLALRSDAWEVELAPEAGGRIARLDWIGTEGRVPVLVPWTDAAAFDPHAWPKAGAFAMLPFANRLAGGCFQWGGRRVQLDTAAGSSDALHGVAHRMRWTPDSVTGSAAVLRYRHRPGDGGWPWPFEAILSIHLGHDAVDVRVAICNRADETAPAGLGWHPYHALRPPQRSWLADLQLAARAVRDVGAVSASADRQSAVGTVGGCYRFDLASLSPQTTVFEDWDGCFRLGLNPAACLIVESTGGQHLVMHVPAPSPGDAGGRPGYLCLEPVSLLPGALQDGCADPRARLGSLEPGAWRSLEWRCRLAADRDPVSRLNGPAPRSQMGS